MSLVVAEGFIPGCNQPTTRLCSGRMGDAYRMSGGPPFDARAVANLLLDLASRDGLAITNLALQKLLYFAHGRFLMGTGKPLVNGVFEAWTYGPVHPAVYQAFKVEGDQPITRRATARDIMTGVQRELVLPEDPEIREHLIEVLRSLGRLSPGRLVDLAHAKNGPWAHVVDKARTSESLGLRITDTVTLERFKYLKIAVGTDSKVGDPRDDTPLV